MESLRTIEAQYADQPSVYFTCKNSQVRVETGPFNWAVICADGSEMHATRAAFAPSACQTVPNKPIPDNQCPCWGNPVNYITKAKFQNETDYAGPQGLTFTRQYSSLLSFNDSSMPAGWHHNYSMWASATRMSGYAIPPYFMYDTQLRSYFPFPVDETALVFRRADGTSLVFYSQYGLSNFIADQDSKFSVTTILNSAGTAVAEYALHTPTADIERYNSSGRLVSIDFKSGRKHTLSYGTVQTPLGGSPSADVLLAVTDNAGRTIQFGYDAKGRMSSMIDPAGKVFTYTIDGSNNLSKVTFPDGLSRTYHYGEPAYTGSSANAVHRLTGISDELSPGAIVRFATYKYNVYGYAISTEHAGGVEKYSFSYDYPTGITDPLGVVRTYSYIKLNSVDLLQYESHPAGAGSNASGASTTYDANGNFKTRTDFNGVMTSYTFNLSTNLEMQRVEASGRPQARTITTEWHPTFRLPLRVAEPKRITTYTYDAAGNQTSRSVQATTDANGSQGMAAVPTGSARTWSATYNSLGQVLTSTGPRSDVVDTTTYVYDDATGNLLTVANAAGQVTSYSNYDAHGRPGLIVAPNNVSTELTYTARGWLASTRVTAGGFSQLSQYEYDGVGHLKRFTGPDGAVTNYSYDAAQRLIGISDSLGNSIAYTLNAKGKKTSEKVRDPGGTLTRQSTATYDVLNRLQQQTGGAL